MARDGNYQGYLKHGDVLTLPFYNIDSASVFIERIDANDSTGQVTVRNIVPKSYTYDSHVLYLDVPIAMYGFPTANQIARVPMAPFSLPLSTSTVAKESLSGRTLALSGGPLIFSNYGASRLGGYSLMVPPTVQATDTVAGVIAPLDNGGVSWAMDAWVFRSAASVSTLWLEANAGLTSYFQIFFDATGHLNISHSGITAYTSGQSVTTGTWVHVALAYDGTNVTSYVNGIAGTPVAYTHGAYTSLSQVRLNHNASNAHYTQSLALYNSSMNTEVFARHYREITDSGGSPGDFGPSVTLGTLATIGLYGGVTYLFSNAVAPYSFLKDSLGNVLSVTLPLLGVAQIQVSSSVVGDRWFYALHIVEREGVE